MLIMVWLQRQIIYAYGQIKEVSVEVSLVMSFLLWKLF